jgi:hypothetical protein
MQIKTLNLLSRRVDNVIQILADAHEDLGLKETHFFKQREGYQATDHHVVELSMLKLICY